jgi:hypothetical protein
MTVLLCQFSHRKTIKRFHVCKIYDFINESMSFQQNVSSAEDQSPSQSVSWLVFPGWSFSSFVQLKLIVEKYITHLWITSTDPTSTTVTNVDLFQAYRGCKKAWVRLITPLYPSHANCLLPILRNTIAHAASPINNPNRDQHSDDRSCHARSNHT